MMMLSEKTHYCDIHDKEQLTSRTIEDLIETSLEHFANEDATILAEAYHNRASSERSLLFLAHCLTRSRSFESAYHILKVAGNPPNGLKTAKSRYIFAYCAFALNRLQEAENTLKDTTIIDQVKLHPSFQDSPSSPYAHSLLARILCETNRVDSAKIHWTHSARQNPMLWTSIRSYCEVGGDAIKELLQPVIDHLIDGKEEIKTPQQITGTPKSNKREGTPASRTRAAMRNARDDTRARIRNAGTDTCYNTPQRHIDSAAPQSPLNNQSSMALRASENSPLTRASKVGVTGGAPLIEQQPKQHEMDDDGDLLLIVNSKKNARRATATARTPLAGSNRERRYRENERKHSECQHNDQDFVYFELMDWLFLLAQVQEHLSSFRCSDALQLLSTLTPPLSHLSLSMGLRARVFFENGEYKRSCEIFEEIRRLYPRRIEGIEIYSTALWQLRESKKLSALAAEMADIARDQPQTWCIAGNCFSLEKQHETAIECFERAICLDSRFGYAYSLLGHELIDMNDMSRAAQAFRKAIQFSPNDYRAWYGLGLVNFREEKPQLARVNLQHAVRINPANTVLLCQLAVIEQALHNNDTAMAYLEQALANQPNNVPCRFHKARLLFDTGRYEQAKKELEELRVLSPDEAHVFFLLGRVNKKLGNAHLALLNFSWATEIDPRGEQNQSALTTDRGPYDDEPL